MCVYPLVAHALAPSWRLRFKAKNGKTVQHNQIISLLMRITNLGFDFIKMENLYTFDGAAGYSLAQGE